MKIRKATIFMRQS